MEEDWDKLADDYAKHPVAMVGSVDCTSDEGQPLCEDFDIQVRFVSSGLYSCEQFQRFVMLNPFPALEFRLVCDRRWISF